MSVEPAVRNELRRLDLDPEVSGLAATALALAAELDAAQSPRDVAALGRELRAVLADIHRSTPEAQEEDALDDLAARRAERRRA